MTDDARTFASFPCTRCHREYEFMTQAELCRASHTDPLPVRWVYDLQPPQVHRMTPTLTDDFVVEALSGIAQAAINKDVKEQILIRVLHEARSGKAGVTENNPAHRSAQGMAGRPLSPRLAPCSHRGSQA